MNDQNPRNTRIALQARDMMGSDPSLSSPPIPWAFSCAHSRRSRFLFLVLSAVSPAFAQAPLLQDGAADLRQARLDWTLGEAVATPFRVPSLEVGLGGAGSGGLYAPLVGGEGFGHGTQGWGVGLQGKYFRGGWSLAATAVAFRDGEITRGVLQRGAIAYQTEGGWRFALEQTPFQWGFWSQWRLPDG